MRTIVKRNDLVTKNVFAIRDLFGNGDGPSVPILSELIRCMISRFKEVGVVANQPHRTDFGELERTLLDRVAGTVAVGQIIKNRATVALWPLGPLQFDLASSFNFDRDIGG